MALRDQPYFPLYVNDFLSDEKLGECSAESTGVYIRLLCIMHKSEEYGTIKLKNKDKITSKSIANFSNKLSKLMPYDVETVERSLEELLLENVIKIEGDKIWQPRMVKDGHISEARAKAGSAGGKSVRDIATKRKYNKPGYLYIVEDCDDELCHKVGISKDPKTRLQQIRSKSKRDMKIVRLYEVDDMGATEDNVLTMLQSIRDGEWIYGVQLSAILKIVDSAISNTTSKLQANPEIEYEDEYENDNDKSKGNGEGNDLSRVMNFYLDRVNATPSPMCIDELKQYTATLGADVVLHALGIALDERKTGWSYIRGILSRYERDGLKNMEAVLQAEQQFKAKKETQKQKQGEPEIQAFTPRERRQEPYNLADMVEWPPGSNQYRPSREVPGYGTDT